jgi:hypothetical protein
VKYYLGFILKNHPVLTVALLASLGFGVTASIALAPRVNANPGGGGDNKSTTTTIDRTETTAGAESSSFSAPTSNAGSTVLNAPTNVLGGGTALNGGSNAVIQQGTTYNTVLPSVSTPANPNGIVYSGGVCSGTGNSTTSLNYTLGGFVTSNGGSLMVLGNGGGVQTQSVVVDEQLKTPAITHATAIADLTKQVAAGNVTTINNLKFLCSTQQVVVQPAPQPAPQPVTQSVPQPAPVRGLW